jgi:hypothetical protein
MPVAAIRNEIGLLLRQKCISKSFHGQGCKKNLPGANAWQADFRERVEDGVQSAEWGA